MVRKILPLALAPSASATEAAPCEDRANSMAEVRICQAELARTRVKLPRSWEMQPDRRP